MLSRIAVRRPITTLMIFAACVMLGVVSYRELSVQLFPDITWPGMMVAVSKEGSTTEILDTVTKPLEDIAAQLPHIQTIQSWTRKNRCWIRLEFDHETDMRFAVIDAEERFNTWLSDQDDRRTRMWVYRFSTEDYENYIMQLSLLGPNELEPIPETLVKEVEQKLKALQGIAEVNVGGRIYESATVAFDPDRLKAYQLGFGQILTAVSAAAADQPDLGRLDTESGSIFVRVGDRIRTIEQLKNVPVGEQSALRLRDVADVSRDSALEGSVYRVNGKSSVGIDLQKEAGLNLIRIAKLTRQRIEEINQTLPLGYRLVVNQDYAKVIEETLDEMTRLALLGMFLAGMVPLFFLRSIRVALIIFLAVPISLIATFNFMYGWDLSINVLTIVGLAIGVSILVDNAIVVLENGFRLAQRGLGSRGAAEQGGREVGRALMASTATTTVVFLPVWFVSGEIRMIFREGALAILFPLWVSLTVALALVPVLTERTLRFRERKEKSRIYHWIETCVFLPITRLWPWRWEESSRSRSLARETYRAILKRALRHRGRVILLTLLLCVATFFGKRASLQRGAMQTRSKSKYFQFYALYPKGTKLSRANGSVRHIENRLREHEAIERFWVKFDDNQARFGMILKPVHKRPDQISWEEFRGQLFDHVGQVPGALLSHQGRVSPMSDRALAFGESGRITLRGPDPQTLDQMAERVRRVLMTFPEITNAEVEENRENPEIEAQLDRERAALFDIKSRTFAQYIQSTSRGGALSSIQLEDGDKRTDVTFEMGGDKRETISAIQSVPLESPVVGSVPLGEVASFYRASASRYFYRVNGQQDLAITYSVRNGVKIDPFKKQLLPVLRSLPNPAGVSIDVSKEELKTLKKEEQAVWMFQLAIALVFIVMAIVFESVWVPFVILGSIPLISVGVVWTLLLSGKQMDELVWFGILLLAGLVVNAPIVMLDLCQRLRREKGFRRTRAVFQACDQRFRPVSMSVLTTVLGLLPLALNPDEGSQWSGMALVVIGGLLSGTILTLLAIPCFYLAVEDTLRWFGPVWSGRFGIGRGIVYTWRGLAWSTHGFFCNGTCCALADALLGRSSLAWLDSVSFQ